MDNEPRQSPYTYPASPNSYNPDQISELGKWNWGAFSLGWIWGASNKCYIALLQLIPIPFVSLVMSILLGIYGNRWAYDHGDVKDIPTFLAIQKTWNTAGLILFIISAASVLLSIIIVLVGSAAMFSIIGEFQSRY